MLGIGAVSKSINPAFSREDVLRHLLIVEHGESSDYMREQQDNIVLTPALPPMAMAGGIFQHEGVESPADAMHASA